MTSSLDKLKKQFPFPSKKPNMPKNNKIVMGWFTPNNQVLLNKYLINRCSKKSVVIEFGTWLGVSANFIAENITDDSTLICVDWWKGDTSIGNRNNEEELYKRYLDNIWNHKDKIIPVRMDGKEAAKYLSKMGIKPDLIYLDMGHSYEEVLADLEVIIPAFPDTIIVGDDYLYWPGVKKAVLEIRYKYDIPYLNVDKNCYALLYSKDRKYMTYNNGNIGKNIEWYSDEEIQYSLVQNNQFNSNKRVFIIPIKEGKNLIKYKDIINNSKITDIIIFVQSKHSIFTRYNSGYNYYLDKIAKNNKLTNNKYQQISFIFIDPEQIVNIEDYKTINGLLSITTNLNNNKETYSSLGNLSIDAITMKKLKQFPAYIYNDYVNRHFLYLNIINNKIVINQYFNKKKISPFEVGHLKSNKKVMKKLTQAKQQTKKSYSKIDKQMNSKTTYNIVVDKQLSPKMYYISV